MLEIRWHAQESLVAAWALLTGGLMVAECVVS
jgi:hypothetical protein